MTSPEQFFSKGAPPAASPFYPSPPRPLPRTVAPPRCICERCLRSPAAAPREITRLSCSGSPLRSFSTCKHATGATSFDVQKLTCCDPKLRKRRWDGEERVERGCEGGGRWTRMDVTRRTYYYLGVQRRCGPSGLSVSQRRNYIFLATTASRRASSTRRTGTDFLFRRCLCWPRAAVSKRPVLLKV